MSNAKDNIDLLAEARTNGGIGGGEGGEIDPAQLAELVTAINNKLDFDDGGTVSGATTFTGALTISGPTTVPTPTLAAHPVTKAYADALVAGQASNARVRVATTANITIATALNNGDVIDDITLATNDLVLVKNQTTASENGIYVVGASPVRDAAFDTFAEHFRALVAVSEGTTNANTIWICMAPSSGTLGSTSIPFSVFSTGAVQTGGDQDIGGTKKFVGTILVPDPGSLDNSTKATPMVRAQAMVAGRMPVAYTTPTGGADGDFMATLYAPYVGQIWRRTSGSWAVYDGGTTWESLPSAASCPGAEFFVTTIGGFPCYCTVYSNGSVFRPTSGKMRIRTGAASAVTGTTSETTAKTFTIPGSLIEPELNIAFRTFGVKSGVAGSCIVRHKIATQLFGYINMTADRVVNSQEPGVVVQNASPQYCVNQTSNDDGIATNDTSTTLGVNLATVGDVTLDLTIQPAATGDSWTLLTSCVTLDYGYGS